MSSDDLPDDFMEVGHEPNYPGSSSAHNGTARRNETYDDEEEEEEEEPQPRGRLADDDDDDEEDSEEEEEEEDGRGGRPRKRQKRNNPVNRFLDVEAEVDNDDDEFDEDEDDFIGTRDFIADDSLDPEESRHRIMRGHQRIERENDALIEQDAEQVARRLKERYASHRGGPARYMGDSDQVPQRLLMPSVQDASLWQVKVKTGREKEIVFSIMRKFLDSEFQASPINIYSAFYRDSLPGIIYIEARNERQVKDAISGLVGVYPSRGFVLVPIDEMASLLKIKKIETNITPGTWVRIKRGKYAGDLAQVLDVTDNGEEAGLKFIPRIDLTPRENDNSKRKKGFPSSAIVRPPQRLFNVEEVSKVWGLKSCTRKGPDEFVFANDTYKRGFLEKDVRINGLIVDNVNPTLDEITMFQAGQDSQDGANALDLSVIAAAAKKAATAVLQPGDHVEVFEGEQIGLDGVVESIRDEVVILRPRAADLDNQKIEVPASSVRKRFKNGDHVKVMQGQNADETGLVVAVNGNVVTIWSDVSNQEVTVFSKDIREAAEVGSGTNAVGQYELHDLVQLDQQTVGVIFKTERVSLRVLDQNGIVRQVQPQQITMRRDSNKAVATDADGQPIRIHDTLKEVAGERRRGTVLHIHQSQVAFLHNRELSENNGIFVVRCRGLTSLTPKNSAFAPKAAVDQAASAAAANAMMMAGRGPRDRLINQNVWVVKGEFKGYMGVVKDTNGNIARVELNTNRKVISIEKAKLRKKDANGKMVEVDSGGSSGNMPPPSLFSRNGSSWGGSFASPGPSSGRTPNPYLSGGQTPGYSTAIAGRTPNPYGGAGGRTGQWGGATPNPYGGAGGRTGQWGAATPNPMRTPARTTGWGDATPRADHGSGASSGASAWGASSSPAWGGGSTSDTNGASAWSTSASSWGGAGSSSPAYVNTPGPMSAPTPGVSASTANTPWSAPTPGGPWGSTSTPAPMSAPTPGGPFSAPTPGIGLGGDMDMSDGDALNDRWLEVCEGHKVYAILDSKGRYASGSMDSQPCLVTEIRIATHGSMSSTADARIDEDGATITTTIEWFIPVRPKLDDWALILSGSEKGRVLKVTTRDPDTGDLTGRIQVYGDKLFSFAEKDTVKIEYP